MGDNPSETDAFARLTADYLNGCLTGATARRYRSALDRWTAWCHASSLDPMKARRDDIEGFIRESSDGYARVSYACALATAIAGCYRFAYDSGYIPLNPAVNIRRPKRDKASRGTWLTRQEAGRLMDHCETLPDPRVAALVETYLLLGVRASEPLNAGVRDLKPFNGRRTLTVRRKAHNGGALRQQLMLAPRLDEAYTRMLGRRADGPLFIRFEDGSRLTSRGACGMVQRACRETGIDRDITPHSLRRTFVTLARDAGIPDRDIMASGGWTNPSMLDYYDRERVSVERHAGVALSAWLAETASTRTVNGPDA